MTATLLTLLVRIAKSDDGTHYDGECTMCDYMWTTTRRMSGEFIANGHYQKYHGDYPLPYPDRGI